MIVTLLSDFGTRDGYVAEMKGAILGRDPRIQLVDVTHEIEPFAITTAAFLMLTIAPSFPQGSVHLAVVDPGVGSPRRPIVVETPQAYFVGPDNGLFAYCREAEPRSVTREIAVERFTTDRLATTFHGRDVFAPVAAELALGLAAEQVGPVISDPVGLEPLHPKPLASGRLQGRVLHVDRFGGCVTNFRPEHFGNGAWTIRGAAAEISEFRACYADGPEKTPFLIWGSAGFLEIAVNRGSAAVALGLRVGDPIHALRRS